jgi:ribosomal subunit interface protein
MNIRTNSRQGVAIWAGGILLSATLAGCSRTDAPPSPAVTAPPAATEASPAASDVPDEASKVQPLARGDQVPSFVVRRPDGSDYTFEAANRASPAVVIFYRGGWCPYCNVHLGQLKAAEATLRARGRRGRRDRYARTMSDSPRFPEALPRATKPRRGRTGVATTPLSIRSRVPLADAQRERIRDKLARKVEANVHVRGKDLHAEAVDGDMYAAIDALSDKLDRMVLKHKEIRSAHRPEGGGAKRQAAAGGGGTSR